MATTFTLTATTIASIQTLNRRADELGTATESKKTEQKTSYSSGQGDTNVQQHYRREETRNSDWDLDLYSSLTDVFGQTIIFERIRSVLVRNRTVANPGDYINVGPLGVANGWKAPFDGDNDARVRIPPGGCFLIDAPLGVGYEVTTTSQMLRIEHDATSANIIVQVEIIGIGGTLESSSSSSCSTSSFSSSSQCTSSLSSISSEKCSESTSSLSGSSQSSISSQG